MELSRGLFFQRAIAVVKSAMSENQRKLMGPNKTQ
jgi:hypothetical protein